MSCWKGQRRISAGDSLPVGTRAEGCHLFASDGLRLNS
jgi:multiple sugar transport system ATP-binding protein